MGGVHLKIETRKLYGLHTRYGTFKVRWKYAKSMLKHESFIQTDDTFLHLFSNSTKTFFWPLLYGDSRTVAL